MIKLKIDVTKIDKSALFKGTKGTYADLVVWENRNGPDQYGNTHYVTQDLGKERRQGGEKAPIIGNGRSSIVDPKRAAPAAKPAPASAPQSSEPADESSVPF